MPFDQPTRNRLARFVADARSLLSEEFTRQLQHEYGMDPGSGDVADLAKLGHLDDARRETARILRATLAHYLAGAAIPVKTGTDKKARQETLQRIVREQAYTVLNRLAALRMAEARGLLIEGVGRGYQSRGFQLYAHLAGPALGETGAAYRSFLFSLFDELAVELPALFDRFSPQGRLFPRETALLRLLDLLNAPDLEALWGEDETIGWIYQYFNSGEERRQMRAESQAPRNSRELAVRNQFFTPRYVVEFLTDNTLGRIWYEMTEGRTALAQTCHYLVRRPVEIFLSSKYSDLARERWQRVLQAARQGDFSQLPEDVDWDFLNHLALMINGYDLAPKLGLGECGDFANARLAEYHATGQWRGSSIELWICLFFEQRRWRHFGEDPTDESWSAIQALYLALRAALAAERAGEGLAQEGLLRQPVYVPHRPLKDPREITMLDPACGSMHFGLYAFDLFERIYEEAWELEASGYASLVTQHAPLHVDFATKEALLRAIPRLIIEHNIHGIDIDPRAVQIAGLSLWLRAQRSWQAQGLPPQERPAITRSHIVCAEPMPGEAALLEEFLAGLRADRLEGLIRRVLDVPATQQVRATARMADALCDLVRTVWQEMRLAGEAGSLLKIEETLANAVRAAEREWSERMPLFRVVEFGLTGEADRVRYPRGVPGQEGADFWTQAEALVLAALHDYAEQAQNGAGYQRRLFASDAARGFAFIDLCLKRYDIALMNPPFGELVVGTSPYFDQRYSASKNDTYAAFVDRAAELVAGRGLVGAITGRNGLVQSNLAAWRDTILKQHEILCLADLGPGVLDDAFVETAAYTIRRHRTTSSGSIVFIDVTKSHNKVEQLASAIAHTIQGWHEDGVYLKTPEFFTDLPTSPLIYRATHRMRSLFTAPQQFEDTIGFARLGLRTLDDFRFVRLIWEVKPSDIGWRHDWVTLNKGGAFSRYYFDFHLLLQWGANGAALKAIASQKYGSVSRIIQAQEYYGQAGLSYPRRSMKGFSVRVVPGSNIFTDKGASIFLQPSTDPYLWLGILNSTPITACVEVQSSSASYELSYVKRLPALRLDSSEEAQISHHARRAAYAKLLFASTRPASIRFYRPWAGESMPASLQELGSMNSSLLREIERFERDAISCADQLLTAHLQLTDMDANAFNEILSQRDRPELGSEAEDEEKESAEGVVQESVRITSEYLLGAALGRWDIRCSANSKPAPELPDLLTPLPSCPPGMLQNAHGLPAAPADVPADYPLRISWPGILVDDPGHPEDIEARVRDALRVIWPGDGNRYSVNGNPISDHRSPTSDHRSLITDHPSLATADQIEQEACQILGVPSLREYFGSPGRFFDDHLKRYSKSRRAAPIYWPLSTASGSYTLWLYYHRLSDQTLYRCVNDFVEPRLRVTGDRLTVIRQRANRSREEERELERLSQFEAELREFRDELLRVAAFWRPNLNDGVQITAAPLWRLFRHRAWQRRLKETWEQLEAGDYDWAHLALSIWPARVVPKCVTDRSLAIAHDLEDVFWVEDPPGSWRNLRSPDEEIAGLVAAQQSPARERLAVLLAELARGRARGLRCAEVWDELAAGRWDDLEAALLLWPERVAEQCWDDPLLAVTLQINLPTKRTKSARERFVKERVAAGCPDLAAALEAALRERPDRFAAFWSELARGDHDHLSLALALWPARVVEKCAADVELAAGHDVRRFLWVRGRRRNAIEQEVVDEIMQRQGIL